MLNEIELTNNKYHLNIANSYQLISNNDFRIIQLSPVAKLTTDNDSIITDFPLEESDYAANPYNKYIIRVNDADGAELNIIVHQYDGYAWLCPVLIGFRDGMTSDILNLTQNWRIRQLAESFVTVEPVNKQEFGIYTLAMKVITTGLFCKQIKSILQHPFNMTVYEAWKQSEELSQHRYGLTAPSSASLILQIFLHTITKWYSVSKLRKRIVRYGGNSICNEETLTDLYNYKPKSPHIIDLCHDVVIYEYAGNNKRKFYGYHVLETARCGHFRHYRNGNVLYIPPTIVHFKKVLPSACTNNRQIVYRNTDDFLRQKSYLEDDIFRALNIYGIEFQREKMFPWLGRKRLDFFLPKQMMAIECQGVQHFYQYGKNDNDFKKRQERDKEKYNECAKNGISLYYYMNEEILLPDNIQNKGLYYSNIESLLKAMKLI